VTFSPGVFSATFADFTGDHINITGNPTISTTAAENQLRVRGTDTVISFTPTLSSVNATTYLLAVGADYNVSMTSAGNAGLFTAVKGLEINASGNLTTTGDTQHYGIDVNGVSGSANNNYGIYVQSVAGATNNYGLRISGVASAATNWGLYVGAAAQNYFAGNVGIGTDTSPDAMFEVENSAALTVDAALLTGSATGTQTTGVDGLQIDIANAGSGAQTNSGLTINMTSNNSNASSILYGLNVGNLTSGGESASEIGLRIGTGWDQGMVIESGSNDGTGFVYSNGGRPTKTITLSPEYAGAVLTASGSASVNGSMTSDASPSAALSNFTNYYEWTSSQTSFQDYTVSVRFKVPKDFSAWATSNAVQISYNTELGGNGSNKLDVIMYNADVSLSSEDQATPIAMRTNQNTSAKTWTQITIDDSEIDAGNARDLDAVDDVGIIYLKMYSKDSNHVQIGDIVLSYLAKF
jgi:hypothetical protein